MNDNIRTMCLIEELQTARELILSGFGELQEIRWGRTFYHLPQQLLASGFERLLKCYFCLIYEARNEKYPGTKFLKDLGHDLQKLTQTFAEEYFNTNNIPVLQDDLEFLKQDLLLKRIIHILSEFGKKARYYNLDIVTGSQKPPINPNEEWEELEAWIEDPVPYLSTDSLEAYQHDYLPKVNARIIGTLERFFRAIARQFTLGKHGGNLQQHSPVISKFIILRDRDLGTEDYRRSVKEIQKSMEKWIKRNRADILNGPWPSALVAREGFGMDWPFRYDEVILECRDRIFCIVNIEGYDFALTGATKSHLGYPSPHDAGLAILGRSIAPFTDMAFTLHRSANGPTPE